MDFLIEGGDGSFNILEAESRLLEEVEVLREGVVGVDKLLLEEVEGEELVSLAPPSPP